MPAGLLQPAFVCLTAPWGIIPDNQVAVDQPRRVWHRVRGFGMEQRGYNETSERPGFTARAAAQLNVPGGFLRQRDGNDRSLTRLTRQDDLTTMLFNDLARARQPNASSGESTNDIPAPPKSIEDVRQVG